MSNPNWVQTFQDTFTRANGAVGNGWTDTAGVFSISANTLISANGNYNNNILYRPVGEALADMKIVTNCTLAAGNGIMQWLGYQGGGTLQGYVFWTNTTNINLGRINGVNGPPSNVQTVSCTLGALASVQYVLARVGNVITATIALQSTPNTIIQTATLTDSTYGSGVAAFSPFGAPNTTQNTTVFKNSPAPSVTAKTMSPPPWMFRNKKAA